MDYSTALTGEQQLLSPSARDVYARMLAGENCTTAEPGLDELVELHLAVQTAADDSLYTARAPRAAEHIIRNRAIAAVRQAADQALELSAFMDRLQEQLPRNIAQREQQPTGRLVCGAAAIDSEVEELVASATRSIWSTQPGPERPRLLGDSKDSRDFRAMRRGVTYRTIYASQACSSQPAAEFARSVEAHGGAVRHTAHPFARMLVFDAATAIVPAIHLSGAQAVGNAPQAWILTDPGSVDFATLQFETIWTHAQPWFATPDNGSVSTHLQRTILRGLLNGQSQTEVATSLGLAQSSISTQLGTLRTRLNLVTRDQLIAWWVTTPEQHIAD